MKKYLILIISLFLIYGCGKIDSKNKAHDGESNSEKEEISKQAIANMGVEVKEVDSSDFTVYEPVPAVIAETSFNELPVFAPFSGRIKNINVKLGGNILKGESVVSIIRDAIPKVELTLTEDILKTAAQNLYTNQYIDGTIDINADKPSEDALLVKDMWKKALEQNGVWNSKAQKLFDILPGKIKENQWVIATIGELAAEGLLSKEVLAWFTGNKKAAEYIIEIGGLMQRGSSLENIKDLYEIGAFEPVINIKAPDFAVDWDVEKISVKQGEKVEAGATLVTLTNHSKMYFIAKPVGSEIGILTKAASEKVSITAHPLVSGVSESVKGLKIAKILGHDDGGTHVYLPVKNKIISKSEQDGVKYRNWMLRNNMRFILQIPVKELKDVIVLPAEAVIDSGSDKVIFVKENGNFIKRKVVVVFSDEDKVVLGEGSDVFPEEAMITKGAFGLNMALQAEGPKKIDAHANCDHD